MYEVRPIQKNVLIKDYNIIIRSLRSKLYFSLFCLFVCVQRLCICIKPMENHNFKFNQLRTQYYAYSKTFTCSTNLPKIGPKVRVVFLQGALKVRIFLKSSQVQGHRSPLIPSRSDTNVCVLLGIYLYLHGLPPKMCEQNV